MVSHFRPVVVMIAIFTLLTGLVMPYGFTIFGKLALPYQAGGSLIERDGHVVGSALIGQNFSSAKYFHGRPSALTGTDPKTQQSGPTPYDASESGASNLGPTNKALIDRVTADVAKAGAKPVPGDMVTTSGSGLDPDISPANAARQVESVAAARKLPAETVRKIVQDNTQGPALGFIGGAKVNVLALNLALDAQK